MSSTQGRAATEPREPGKEGTAPKRGRNASDQEGEEREADRTIAWQLAAIFLVLLAGIMTWGMFG